MQNEGEETIQRQVSNSEKDDEVNAELKPANTFKNYAISMLIIELITILIDANRINHGLRDDPNIKYFTRSGTKYISGCENKLE